jgi:uncharacterized phage protein gp47/JayE
MATYGVTSTGFVAEPLAQSQADIFAALQSAFGADIDPSANGPFGLLAAIMADRESSLWQMGQAVYGAAYPDTASGTQLDDVCALTGVVRLAPSKSSVSEVLVGTNGTSVPSSTTFATSTSGVQFATSAVALIATLTAYGTGPAFAVGALVTNAGNVYSCTTAIAVGTTPPTGTGTSITDGTGTWRYCGAGTAAVAATCLGIATGPLAAPAGTLTVISTPVAGLTSVTNPLDATQGTNQETDAALRLRRTSLLQAQGKSPVAALQAALLKVSGVTGAFAIENATDAVDGSGRPPHSVECVVTGGADLAVATAIFNAKAAGIQTTGSYTPQNVTDPTSGVVYSITFTRPSQVAIYVVVNLKKGASWPSSTGVATAQAAVVAWALGQIAAIGNTAFVPGQTVYAGPISAAIIDQMPGTQIVDITSVFIGTAPAPGTNTPITMLYNQVAAFDTSRVTINAT